MQTAIPYQKYVSPEDASQSPLRAWPPTTPHGDGLKRAPPEEQSEPGSDPWLRALGRRSRECLYWLLRRGATVEEAVRQTRRKVLMPLRIEAARATFASTYRTPSVPWAAGPATTIRGASEPRPTDPSPHVECASEGPAPDALAQPVTLSACGASASVSSPPERRRFLRGRPRPNTPTRELPAESIRPPAGSNRAVRRQHRWRPRLADLLVRRAQAQARAGTARPRPTGRAWTRATIAAWAAVCVALRVLTRGVWRGPKHTAATTLANGNAPRHPAVAAGAGGGPAPEAAAVMRAATRSRSSPTGLSRHDACGSVRVAKVPSQNWPCVSWPQQRASPLASSRKEKRSSALQA